MMIDEEDEERRKILEKIKRAAEETAAQVREAASERSYTGHDRGFQRVAEKLEEEEQAGVSITMRLPTETVLDVKFLQEYLRLPTRADAVTAAISISSLLLREIKRGSTVYVESKIGSKSKLSLGGKNNVG